MTQCRILKCPFHTARDDSRSTTDADGYWNDCPICLEKVATEGMVAGCEQCKQQMCAWCLLNTVTGTTEDQFRELGCFPCTFCRSPLQLPILTYLRELLENHRHQPLVSKTNMTTALRRLNALLNPGPCADQNQQNSSSRSNDTEQNNHNPSDHHQGRHHHHHHRHYHHHHQPTLTQRQSRNNGNGNGSTQQQSTSAITEQAASGSQHLVVAASQQANQVMGAANQRAEAANQRARLQVTVAIQRTGQLVAAAELRVEAANQRHDQLVAANQRAGVVVMVNGVVIESEE